MANKTTIFDRFQQMSRFVQVLAVVGVAVILFMVWNGYLQPIADQWAREGDRIEDRARQVRAGTAVARELQAPQTKGLVTALGPVRIPVPIEEGSKSLNDVCLEVIQKHRATNFTFSSRSQGSLPRNAMAGGVPGNQVQRLTGDLKFDATPQTALAIIAELESSPHIDAINNVRILRDTGGRVKVTLLVEAWLLSTDTASGGTV